MEPCTCWLDAHWSTVRAVIIFVSLILIALCFAFLGLTAWWVWSYIFTSDH